MNRKNSARFVVGFVAAMTAVSGWLVWKMIQNYSTDASKQRSKLVQQHKKALKEKFVYSQQGGQEVYNQFCLRCHGSLGQGSATAPPLAGSAFVTGEKKPLIKAVNYGMRGKIIRNGKTYNAAMPGFPMITHEDMAHVLSFVRNSFGNEASVVTKAEVIRVKIDHAGRKRPFTANELRAEKPAGSGGP